ncbi:unnamed protein product [Adineta steineri]|uniref:OCIA domain-containing protein n=1 Tax=Adineta steineri TaxID=433720 RepID=A0A819BUN6_9BILA|nr:unnamed protein product [Adineta steineri]CAF3797532.1 unnamed protein product [Adineta steineri]
MANTNTQFRLTKEESALMDECRKSSFWYRSVPLMAITTGLLTYLRLNNFIPPKLYGFKLAGTTFAAYILGKVSYIPECRRLILERLPNSNLAHSFESKPYDMISDMAQPPEIVSKTTTNNIFGTRNEEEQHDDLVPRDPIDKNTSSRYVTYDELRQRNRAEHATKFPGTKPPTNNPMPPTPIQDNRQLAPLPIISNEQVATRPITSKRSNARKNQYGDEVYD